MGRGWQVVICLDGCQCLCHLLPDTPQNSYGKEKGPLVALLPL